MDAASARKRRSAGFRVRGHRVEGHGLPASAVRRVGTRGPATSGRKEVIGHEELFIELHDHLALRDDVRTRTADLPAVVSGSRRMAASAAAISFSRESLRDRGNGASRPASSEGATELPGATSRDERRAEAALRDEQQRHADAQAPRGPWKARPSRKALPPHPARPTRT